jgi:hypothetical protein
VRVTTALIGKLPKKITTNLTEKSAATWAVAAVAGSAYEDTKKPS